jgi:4,5-DOPA dioxygenase extradiol
MALPAFDPHAASLFISHGAPSLLLDDGPGARFLRDFGARIARPKAIVCMSAHWETAAPRFDASPAPQTIHDFSGFPEAMYRMRYPAPGAPDLARKAIDLCAAAGITADSAERGLDHGAWVPLMALFPGADIPVVQASLPFGNGGAQGARGVFEVGRALGPLLREGVLLLASGGFTHNLREIAWGGGEPDAWARNFQAWAVSALRESRLDDLLDAPARAPDFHRAHPRAEHWLPLFFALGAAASHNGASWRCETLYEAFEFGSLAMDAYAFYPQGKDAV